MSQPAKPPPQPTLPELNLGPGIFVPSRSEARPMTESEARVCVDRINGHFRESRQLIYDLHQREGWKALGYKNWTECVQKEFVGHERHAWRELSAAMLEANLLTPGSVGTFPEGELRGLDAETLQQAKAELLTNWSVEPHYEPHEDAEPISPEYDGKGRHDQEYYQPTLSAEDQAIVQAAKNLKARRQPAEPVARGAKEIIAKAKEIKARQKEEKRAVRRLELEAKAQTFDQTALIGSVEIHCADSRQLHTFVQPGSVQLVVTSPPYNVGMPYREHDDELSNLEYAKLLQAVFSECFEALCEGGRIAVVVPFGVGRHPWTPVASVVADHLCAVGFTLRGQIVWHKGTFNTSTAWGTYRSPASPILRDTNECILIAQKGKDALDVPESIFVVDEVGKCSPLLKDSDDFMKLATDYWPIQPESAEAIGHPCPFPVALASNLIRFYAYPGAHVLDPFAGSGTTGIAAKRLACRATLIDIDPAYCELARERCERDQN